MIADIQINTVEDQIYRILLNQIRTLQLPPGSRINENKIAEDLQVSRSPVRDAIKRLKGDNLIVIIPYKGAFVRKLTSPELKEMYEVRLMMEKHAFGCVEFPLKEEDEDRLLCLRDRLEAAYEEKDLDGYRLVDFSLHESIVSLCHNKYLSNIYENLNWQLYALFLESEWDFIHFERVQNDHLNIIRNLLDGKPDQAREILTAHVERAQELIIAHSEKESGYT